MKSANTLTDTEIAAELDSLGRSWDEVRSGDGHGGSPGEWIWERMGELETEQRRRDALAHPADAATKEKP